MDEVSRQPLPEVRPELESELGSDDVLASLGGRFRATLIDGAVLFVSNVGVLVALGRVSLEATQLPAFSDTVINMLIAFAGFVLLQLYFLRSGQTIGKRLLGLRIVDVNTGQPPSAAKLIALRYFPVFAIPVAPVVGALYPFADGVFIFRNDRRCLHDLVAGTKVVLVVGPSEA